MKETCTSLLCFQTFNENCCFSYFSHKTHGVGTQKNHLNEKGSFEHQKLIFEPIGKKVSTVLSSKYLLIWTCAL